jgi:hypothetical protein
MADLLHQEAVDRFFSKTVTCAVCTGTAWDIGPEFDLADYDPDPAHPFAAFGRPAMVVASFVCRECQHTLFIRTGRLAGIPATTSSAGSTSL